MDEEIVELGDILGKTNHKCINCNNDSFITSQLLIKELPNANNHFLGKSYYYYDNYSCTCCTKKYITDGTFPFIDMIEPILKRG